MNYWKIVIFGNFARMEVLIGIKVALVATKSVKYPRYKIF